MQFEQQAPKVILKEAEKYNVSIINYLEVCLVWEDATAEANSETLTANLVTPRNAAGEDEMVIICMTNFTYQLSNFLQYFNVYFSDATKGKDSLMYFLQYTNDEIAIMATDDATVKYPQLVRKYLEDNIA